MKQWRRGTASRFLTWAPTIRKPESLRRLTLPGNAGAGGGEKAHQRNLSINPRRPRGKGKDGAAGPGRGPGRRVNGSEKAPGAARFFAGKDGGFTHRRAGIVHAGWGKAMEIGLAPALLLPDALTERRAPDRGMGVGVAEVFLGPIQRSVDFCQGLAVMGDTGYGATPPHPKPHFEQTVFSRTERPAPGLPGRYGGAGRGGAWGEVCLYGRR